MPSPFPGMDPYLERPGLWPGVHASLIQDIKRQLVISLPRGYFANTDVDLHIFEPPAEERRVLARADDAVMLTSNGSAGRPSRKGDGGAAIAEPAERLAWPAFLHEERQNFVEVRDRENREVVTVIELVSPTNKAGGRLAFVQKRQTLHEAGTHFLQIDLLRAGRPLLPDGAEPPAHDYSALLLRAGDDAADFWHWTVREALPVLPVPLKALDVTYDASRYGEQIYGVEIEPPLPGAMGEWAAGLVG